MFHKSFPVTIVVVTTKSSQSYAIGLLRSKFYAADNNMHWDRQDTGKRALSVTALLKVNYIRNQMTMFTATIRMTPSDV